MHFVKKDKLILVVHDGFIVENRLKRELVKVMEDKWNKHWRIRGVRSSKPIIRETPHYTFRNTPIVDIFDTFPEIMQQSSFNYKVD